MAINQVELFIYTALVLLLQNGIGFALRIDITPSEVNGLIHNDVCISCELETSDSDVREIMLLELSKDNMPIALLRQKSNVTVEKGLESKFRAEGKIHNSVHTSYIRATLSNPDLDDSGEYTCQMYFLDQLDVLKDTRKSSNLTVSDQNLKSAMKYLVEKVSGLETELAAQTIDKDQLKKELQGKIESQEQNLKKISDTASFTTAFSVESPNKTVYTQGDILLFTKSTLNVGGNYNMDSGVFTAPRKGLYVFHVRTSGLQDTAIRLVGGSSPSQGRVEISRGGPYGTVCDDAWSNNDAIVICRMLGYTGGTAYASAHFGQGSGNILLDDVNCAGTELDVFRCPHRGWGVSNCGHSEDASVSCGAANNVHTAYEGYFHLKVNNKIVESAYVYNQPSWESGSISVVTILNPGDHVKPVAETESNLKIEQQYTDFSGYLLKLL